MKKILMEMNLKSGGVEKFIVNLMKYISPKECELHFAVPYAEDHVEFYEPFVKEWGAVVHKLGGGKEISAYNRKSIINKRVEFYKLLKKERFDVCYINVGGAGAAHIIETYMALLAKVPVVLVHSHTSGITEARLPQNSFFKKKIHSLFRYFWPQKKVKYLACSEMAAQWLYPRIAGKGNYEFIPNAIDTKHFEYSEADREEMRKEYNIRDELVILNVGRLSKPKNHVFLLKVFKEVVRRNPDAKLILVGEGELEETIKTMIHRLELLDNVIMIGAVKNVAPYYSMADVFLFPSLYEGLGIVLLEAQVNGIPILASDAVPKEVKVNPSLEFLSLIEKEEIWAEKVIELSKTNRCKDAISNVVKKGYDLSAVNKQMRILLGLA